MTETILVKGWADEGHENGVLINKSDFVKGVHVIFGAEELEFLKRNAADIIADLPAANDEELAEFLEAEKSGKNRKGVVEAIESEIADRAEK